MFGKKSAPLPADKDEGAEGRDDEDDESGSRVRGMKAITARAEWVLLVDLHEGAWAVQVVAGEPEPGMICKCAETGRRFSIEVSGSVNARALVAGKRVLRFCPISPGPQDLREGYRMNQE